MAGRSVLLLLTGALLGVVATLVARPAGRSVGGDSEATGVASLSRDLEALRTDVLALRELIERQRALPPVAANDTPVPLTQSPDPVVAQLGALQSELKALSERIDAQSSASSTALAELKTELEGAASGAEPMPESLPDTPLDLQSFDRISGRSEDELTDEHLLWTYDQVTGTYGRPSGIRPSPSGGGIKFFYDLPGGKTCIFWFKGGKLVRVIWA
jgi:hypothetical protein